MLNNKGFLLPTVMVYIFLFLFLIFYMFYESLTYQVVMKSYQNQVKYELAILEANDEINKYLGSRRKFEKLCKKDIETSYNSNYKLTINNYCFAEFTLNPFEAVNSFLKIDKLEYSESEYNEKIKELENIMIKQKSFIKKIVNLIIDKVIDNIPYLGKAKEVWEKVKKEFIKGYIAFDINIKINKNKHDSILVIYDYKKKEVRTVVHT